VYAAVVVLVVRAVLVRLAVRTLLVPCMAALAVEELMGARQASL
jgi:hypothetical protein